MNNNKNIFEHPDLIKAIEEGKSIMELEEMIPVIKVCGSFDNFNKEFGDLNANDQMEIKAFFKFICNYVKVKKIYNDYIANKGNYYTID